MSAPSDSAKPPLALDAIVDRVLVYNPKDGKARAKKHRQRKEAEDSAVLVSRRREPPTESS